MDMAVFIIGCRTLAPLQLLPEVDVERLALSGEFVYMVLYALPENAPTRLIELETA